MARRSQDRPMVTGGGAELENMLNSLISLGILIPNREDVRDYLLRYSDMADVTRAVCRIASKRFSARPQLSLEVYRDPEVEDEYLTLYVRQREYDETVMQGIKAARKEYESKLVEKSGWLLLTTDIQPPRGTIIGNRDKRILSISSKS